MEGSMKNQSNEITFENDYFSSRQMDDILVFSYKGNSLLASTLIKAKKTVLDFFKQVETQTSVRVVVLLHGPRKPRREEYLAFFDMVASARLSETAVMRLYRAIDQIILFIQSSDLFFIAANCGEILPMMIGGSLACDYKILGDNAAIQNPSLEVGLAPKGGAPFFLSHTIGRGKIYDLMLSDHNITAQEAITMGLADRCVSMETFEKDVMMIASQFAALPSSSLRLAKRLVNYPVVGLDSYLEYENKQLLRAMNQTGMVG
jgi:2-(1,2-epoxy-1,2-dihydrophenyl)acetyl-CoA isomerase